MIEEDRSWETESILLIVRQGLIVTETLESAFDWTACCLWTDTDPTEERWIEYSTT